MMSMSSSKRLEQVDIAKAIGVIIVVLSHTDAYELMSFASGFYVPIFFFCSGYMYKPGSNLKQNVKKRFFKLIKPYFFFNVLLLVCFWGNSLRDIIGVFYSRYCLYLPDVVPNIKFFTSGNYPLWFLTCMFVSYMLFYILIYSRKYRWILIIFYFALTALMDLLPILLPWSIDTAFLMSLVMFMGKLYHDYECVLFVKASQWKVFFTSLVVYVVAMWLDGDMNISVRVYGMSFMFYFIAAVSGSILLMCLSRLLESLQAGHWLSAIGKHSLTIFCIEIPFIYYGREVLKKLLSCGDIMYNPIILGILEWMIAVVGGYLVSLLLLRIPQTRKILT
jgi:fucose 4-O-acetylase-like acetyltransferase